jgi:hypothetical protein
MTARSRWCASRLTAAFTAAEGCSRQPMAGANNGKVAGRALAGDAGFTDHGQDSGTAVGVAAVPVAP